MTMAKGQTYGCQNRDSGCEVEVIKSSSESNSNPRCSCGAEMKKPFKEVVLRRLNPDAEVLVSFKRNPS
jgi:hypothetical protein